MNHLNGAAPFPDNDDRDTFYVKLSWNNKAFKVVESSLVEPSPPCTPPVAAPPSRCPAKRALPVPDLTIMQRASSVEVRCSRLTLSVGRAGNLEAESLHSATKLSASKCLSAKRREASARTPGVRKRLELSSESFIYFFP